jgi:hypothetical protein
MEDIRNNRENSNTETELTGTRQKRSACYDRVLTAFANAELILPHDPEFEVSSIGIEQSSVSLDTVTENSPLSVAPLGLSGEPVVHSPCANDSDQSRTSLTEYCPIVPLGHKNGIYSFISPSGELRSLKAEALEAGRGVQSLFSGVSRGAESWCRSNFPTADNGWAHKEVGLWIIKSCNAAGVFDPSCADMRLTGVWRAQDEKAVAHCGNCIVYPEGQMLPLSEYKADHFMIGAAPIALPAKTAADCRVMAELLESLRHLWGWKRRFDPDIFFGWIAAAYLGGYPGWRAHLYVFGSRGSGKSKLMELAASLLGDLAGGVLNDATEAGLRQSRNNQARPVLIDEFEPDDNARNGARQDSMLALFRRMSGGNGGRISRGGADHSSVSFRTLGAAYVTSINQIELEPQDRSRFVMLELDSVPDSENPAQSAADLQALESHVRLQSSGIFRRMLAQSRRWDATQAAIAGEARSLGADARQAATVSTILTGRDLALFDDPICAVRLRALGPYLHGMLGDASEADVASEGVEALDHLLSSVLHLDQGIRRSVQELLKCVITDTQLSGVVDPNAALNRTGIHVLRNKQRVAVRLGKTSPVAKLYSETKWRSGAHGSALLKLDGVEKPSSAVRLSQNLQQRAILIPFDCLPFEMDEYL